jgi:hypothetical protein
MKFNVLLKYYWEDAGQTVVFVAITCFVQLRVGSAETRLRQRRE